MNTVQELPVWQDFVCIWGLQYVAFVIVKGLQRTALFFISLLGVGEGGGAEPYGQIKENVLLHQTDFKFFI